MNTLYASVGKTVIISQKGFTSTLLFGSPVSSSLCVYLMVGGGPETKMDTTNLAITTPLGNENICDNNATIDLVGWGGLSKE